jgi:hypothetical protein
MKNHYQYAARINGMYLCPGSTRDNQITSRRKKEAKHFPSYVAARTWALSVGGNNTVSLDQHGLVGVVDEWSKK